MSGFHPYQAVLRQQLENRQTGVDLVLLEAAYNDDSLKCESQHARTGKENCTVDVTHIVSVACRNQSVRVCAVSAAKELAAIGENAIHDACDSRYADCVSVRPI